MTTGPRFDPFTELGLLEPLDGAHTVRSTRRPARTTGPVTHGCRIESHGPTLADGREPERPGHVLRHALEFDAVTVEGQDRVCFDHDGYHVRAQVRAGAGAFSVYGLGEHAGPLLRDGRSHLLWNTDAYGYDAGTRALYQSHPWAVCVHGDGSATGVLFDTYRRGTIACFADGLEATFEEAPFDVHLVDGPAPEDVLRALAAMVGPAPRVPVWAFGYHQCRYSYMDEAEVRSVAARLRAERIPCDAIWFDIDYMDRHRVFSWDAERFPDPKALTDDLRALGFASVAILDPGVVDDDEDPVRREAVAGDHLLALPDGALAGGRVWPGACHFPDFTRSETRAWWAERVREFVTGSGLDGVWCDMNEPALLGAPTRTLREDAVHRGVPAGRHAEVHNLYGHLMVEATHAGVSAARPDERPFVLTRAAHLKTAALAATWTGDNQSHWDDLRWTIAMVLNLGMSGQALAGPDIGGFSGEADAELFVRWFELGAYLPFCRGHAEKGTPRKEPWSFGDEATDHVRAALRRRMALLPTFLALADEAATSGVPICRPVAFADPTDPELRAVDDAFLLGPDLLVAPVTGPGIRERGVRLPAGRWAPLAGSGGYVEGSRSITVATPLGSTPVFVREGAVVVMDPAPPETTRERRSALHLEAFIDAGGRANGVVVLDDGCSVRRFDVSVSVVDGGTRVRFEPAFAPEDGSWTVRVHDDRGGVHDPA